MFPDDWSLNNELMARLLLAVGFIILIVILVQVSRHLANRYIDEPERRYRVRKLIGRIGGVVAILLTLGALFQNASDFITVLTVVGAGLAIAMRETLLSIAGWFYIAFRTPYKHGDRVQIGDIRGDVIDIRLLHTTLMEIGGWVEAEQSTGRIVHIPNAQVYQEAVFNYTRGFQFIWNELVFTVTFQSDWRAALEILRTLANESAAVMEQQAKQEIQQVSREYLIHYSILTPFVYVQVTQNGVQLTLRYLCEARKRRGTAHAITTTFLDQVREKGGIAFATQMVGVTTIEAPPPDPLPDPSAAAARTEDLAGKG